MSSRKRSASTSAYVPRFKKVLLPSRLLMLKQASAARRRGITRPELKYSDTAISAAVNTTGSVSLLHVPVLGTDYTNRIGRKTVIKSVFLRGLLSRDNTTPSALSCQCRMILVLDKQPNGATPSIADILVNATSYAQLNPNNRDRFRVIRDEVWVLGPNGVGGTNTFASPNSFSVETYVKLSIPVIFNGANGGTAADINSNALYLVWIGNLASGNSDGQIDMTARVRFNDE